MSTRVTVGYDTTPASLDAVAWAAREAENRDEPLRIVSCYEIAAMRNVYPWIPTRAIDVVVTDTEAKVAQVKDIVAASHPGLVISTEVWAGRASTVLLKDAGADDLIVVGASSHEGAAAFWLGSTPRYLVRHSPCPVVVVRDSAGKSAPARVVVGIDGSAAADVALRWAGEEADRHHVGLLVVHAWTYPYRPADIQTIQARDLMQVDAECVLDAAVESARERFAAAVDARLVEDSPAAALLGFIQSGDLVVVGSRGRGAVIAGLLGSTVNHVLERCVVPVVVVPGRR